ncbi:N-acetylglucosamine-binding protein GbpA [Cupriavidus basilensis]|uniref:N-acetylglucosamine-binding protein GbpA n=1 Tax=Cupriavidus basilensis TaxID=68895 RepID=UPI0020A6604F|nr:N-acetylglucosamine-binding protein GbpA [Cupriavidus basilensis]MCP3024474.1 N-acetylglucosamine-binding protein GbpA [Cupriavidus basilensis]
MKLRSTKKTLLKLSPLVACASMFFAQQAFAHGYMSMPESRNLLCSSKQNPGKAPENFSCGSIQWEPQSIEGKQGFPNGGPLDGQIASAGISQFSPLDEQTADRWKIKNLTPGTHDFKWTFTAAHKTKDFKYYITKQGWNANKPLTRDQFDLMPFCTVDGGMKVANEVGSHRCTIPSDRSGYHVILSTWHVGDTAGMFYNVADVNVTKDGSGPTDPGKPDWSEVGSILPTTDLSVGDKVSNRVFKSTGEVADMKTTITITKKADGTKDQWPMLLAKEINRLRGANLMAGVQHDGRIEPGLGKNDVFAKKGSNITRTETSIEEKPTPGLDEDFTMSNNTEFKIQNGKATANFFLKLNHSKETDVTVKVYDSTNKMVGAKSAVMKMQGDVAVDISDARPGNHIAVATSKIKDGGTLMQQNSEFKLTGDASGGEGALCYSAWKKGTAYTGGAKVQHKGQMYEARWWTTDEPGLPQNTGADHTGKVWKSLGACSK